jgi:formylmethanofuran dehydrogenase subunit E
MASRKRWRKHNNGGDTDLQRFKQRRSHPLEIDHPVCDRCGEQITDGSERDGLCGSCYDEKGGA